MSINITSPFNFVTIDSNELKSDGEIFFNRYDDGKYTGHIMIEIKPQKNLFIRGLNEAFYKTGDKYAIPGSTIKGMLSQLIEAISFSKPRVYQEKLIYQPVGDSIKLSTANVPDDFAGILFGADAKAQGKIYVEDAICDHIPDTRFSCRILKILQQPRPDKAEYYSEKNNGKRYFKGFKFYWHRQDEGFSYEISVNKEAFLQFFGSSMALPETELQRYIDTDKYKFNFKKIFLKNPPAETDQLLKKEKKLFEMLKEFLFSTDNESDKKKQIHQTIANVLTDTNGIVFTGRIRFENLNSTELGILLMALQLQEDCFHHIGMAKPYGFGRVKIGITTIFRSNRRARYENLFNSGGEWNLSEKKITDEIQDLKNRAAIFLLNELQLPQVGEFPEKSFWAIDRMRDLCDLHKLNPYTVREDLWNSETQYPGIIKGKKRLPSVDDVRRKMTAERESLKK